MILPTIHMNGTSPEDLREGYLAAYRAVTKAEEALNSVEFNARDYYPQGDAAWRQAKEEMNERRAALGKVANECMELATHCDNEAATREARRHP